MKMHYRYPSFLAFLALALTLLISGCATATQEREAKMVRAAIAARNGGGTGFICNTDPVNGATGCACIEGETGADSCNGMDRMCRVLGGNMTCDSEGFCACGGTLGPILQ